MFAALSVVVAAREAGLVSFRVPENARLVPERVRDLGEYGALQFGFEMGTGMRTYSPSALPHLTLLAVITVVPFTGAFVLAAGFAVGRFAMPLLSNAHGTDGSWTTLWNKTRGAVAPLLAFAAISTVTAAAWLS
jgi:hypothetical protein